MSEDPSKLGEIPRLLSRVICLRQNLKKNDSQISNILDEEEYKKLDISNLRKLLRALNSIKGDTLGEYLESMLKRYSKINCNEFRQVIIKVLDLDKYTFQDLKGYVLSRLYQDLKDEEQEAAIENIEKLFSIQIEEYDAWFNFIQKQQDYDSIVYHTYHSTKGLEFNNVIIVMQNAFGRTKSFFDFFFLNKDKLDDLNSDEKIKYEDVRNLLYVSCSRAIKNLRVLYTDDISTFKGDIENIFGDIQELST